MNERLVALLGHPVIQALIVVGMALLYLRLIQEYRRALRRRLEDPKWKGHHRLLLLWRWRMWAVLGGGALVFLVVAVDLFGGTSSSTTTWFKWGFGFFFLCAGTAAFLEGFLEGSSGNPDDAA